jgi:hypothetical protein
VRCPLGGEPDRFARGLIVCSPGLGRRSQAPEDATVLEDADHGRLTEHEAGALFRVVGVDGHVRGSREQDAEDAEVQLARARCDPHPHPVPAADTGGEQGCREALGAHDEFAVAERAHSVLERGGLRMCHGDGTQDVDQGAFGGRTSAAEQRRLPLCEQGGGGLSVHARSSVVRPSAPPTLGSAGGRPVNPSQPRGVAGATATHRTPGGSSAQTRLPWPA